MRFSHPERLWLLVGVAALVATYVVTHLRHRQAVARYTNPALHHLIAPDRLGARRHLAPALTVAALAVLLVGLAQPLRMQRVARNEGVVVLAVDVSASMTATDIAPSRIEAAIAGATAFVKDIPPGIKVGLVAFDGDARLLVSPTADHSSVLSAVRTLTPGPRTAAGEGVYTSLQAIKTALPPAVVASAARNGEHPAAIVLLSDGTTTVGRPVEQAADAAARAGVPISTIAYGTPTGTVTVQGQIIDVPADTATMAAVAKRTGGGYYEATSAGQLRDVYSHIQTTIGYRMEPREVARGFLGGALALLVGAGAAAVAVGRRRSPVPARSVS